jgi:hypothetical protein
MPEFRTGQPVQTETPDVEVTVTPSAPLPVGRHRFQLVVEDDSGNSSQPAIAEVIVRDNQKPTAVLDAPQVVQPFNSMRIHVFDCQSGDRDCPGLLKYQPLDLV